MLLEEEKKVKEKKKTSLSGHARKDFFSKTFQCHFCESRTAEWKTRKTVERNVFVCARASFVKEAKDGTQKK
jgi:hypothetical protein